MNWHFDLTNIPRGRTEKRTFTMKGQSREIDVFVPEKILIAHPTDGKVYQSYWIPPKYTQSGSLLEGDRWSGWNVGVEPVAWAEWPEHPIAAASQGEAVAPSAPRVSPQADTDTGSGGANEGGDHVTVHGSDHHTLAGGHVCAPSAFHLDDCGSGA